GYRVEDLVDERAVGRAEVDLYGRRADRGDRGDRPGRLAGAARFEVPLEVPHHGVGVERRAVGELHPLAKGDRDRLAAVGELIPGGQVRDDLPLRAELDQLTEDRVHLALVGGAVDVRRRVQAGWPVTRETGPLQHGQRPAGLRRAAAGLRRGA